MSDATSVLFGLEHEFNVLEVERVDTRAVKVVIEQTAREGPCPECGVLSGTVKDRPWMRLKDLPVFGQTVQVWWRKRRLICAEALCPRKTGLPRVFRTVELCYFMLRLARLDIRCGPGVGSGSLTRSGAVADYRRFQYSGQYLVSL